MNELGDLVKEDWSIMSCEAFGKREKYFA